MRSRRRVLTRKPMNNHPMSIIARHQTRGARVARVFILSIILLSWAPRAESGKNKPPPTPTPTPSATPTPAPTPTPTPPPTGTPTPAPTPANTSRAASADKTIDNRFVTIALQIGDGRKQAALDIYSNALVHSNARLATSQGFYTASQRGSSGLIQNPTPAPTPTIDPATLWRNDPLPKTAVDWGWVGNKKPKKPKVSTQP